MVDDGAVKTTLPTSFEIVNSILPGIHDLPSVDMVGAIIAKLTSSDCKLSSYEQLALIVTIRCLLASKNTSSAELEELTIQVCKHTSLIPFIKKTCRILSDHCLEQMLGESEK